MKVSLTKSTLISVTFFGKSLQYCKPTPGTANWPSDQEWQSLNNSVSGRMQAVVPPGGVCHPSRAEYNSASCKSVNASWSSTSFQAQQPVSVDYNDETCLPNAVAPCSGQGYPQYVIVATEVADVQKSVSFARRTGVRLVIKATGHDFLSRSSGGDSLSIYTHNLRGITINRTDTRATALGGIASVKLFAGTLTSDLYAFGSQQKVTMMGGANMDVGIGGWVSGAGHGPLTAMYGLGADQVLEMDVVTADGCFHTINADCGSDLFWALRGGGAGTFAVLISMTVKAYPSVNVSAVNFSYNTTTNSDAFWNLAAYFHTQLPHLSESGLHGYYTATPGNGIVSGFWLGPNLSPANAKAILAPMEAHMGSADSNISATTKSTAAAQGDFMTFWSRFAQIQTAGTSVRLGSRLLSNGSLLGDFNTLKTALRQSTPSPWQILGHLVGPAPNTRRPTGGIAGGNDSVLPAWRTTYTHAVLVRNWPTLNETAKMAVTTDLRDVRVPALRNLSPNTGAYMSESDPTEPNWQQTKFGANYQRLLQIKQKWDAAGVFWCTQCVGSELWNATGNYGIENGVGQNKVQLCMSSAPPAPSSSCVTGCIS